MLYDDRFAGHLDSLDPRTPLFAPGACDWPTIPAYRYMIVSDDATSVMSVLNTTGILIEHRDIGGGVNLTQWDGPKNIVPVTLCLCTKTWVDSGADSLWQFLIVWPFVGALLFSFTRSLGPCNVPMAIGDRAITGVPSAGSTGASCRMLQVEWDQDLPPNWP